MLNWNNLLTALAETAATTGTTDAAAAQSGGMISTIIMLVVMVAIFYFLLIRPQRKKDKKVKEMLSALKAGDRICTIGGIYGTIVSLKDDTVTLAVPATLDGEGRPQTRVIDPKHCLHCGRCAEICSIGAIESRF